jgi:hypothetical protein
MSWLSSSTEPLPFRELDKISVLLLGGHTSGSGFFESAKA